MTVWGTHSYPLLTPCSAGIIVNHALCTLQKPGCATHQPTLKSVDVSTCVRDRSWNHLTGQQLDCFKFAPAEPPDTVADAAAHVSSATGTSADGGVPAASAMLQSDAAKQDLGDDADTGIGKRPSLHTLSGPPDAFAFIIARACLV